jgi:predicted nucleic acid-binding protein
VKRRVAVLDACVLHPAPLRDLLLRLAMTELYRARWSEAIHDEWMRSIRQRRPDLTLDRLERTRRLMDASVPDSLVMLAHRHQPQRSMSRGLPDPDDEHVLAAAVQSGAEVIVTHNLDDFPAAVLQPHGVTAEHPDTFLCGLLRLSPLDFIDTVRKQQGALRNPPRTMDELLVTLDDLGLSQTVAELRRISR